MIDTVKSLVIKVRMSGLCINR